MAFWYTPDMVRYSKNLNTNASGVAIFDIPQPDLVLDIQPRTLGEFVNSISQVGSTITVTFKKFKGGGLGITLGTLLTVTAFEDTPGVVNFDVIGVVRTPD